MSVAPLPADPLDAVTDLGLRVIWVNDLDGDVLLLESEGLVLVDTDLSRQMVADTVRAEVR